MLEDLSIVALEKIKIEALKKEEFEKAIYIEWLIKQKLEEPETYSMDMETQINIILDEFNFEKVSKVMEFLGWVWYKKLEIIKDDDGNIIGSRDLTTQPCVDELKKSAYNLLKRIWEEDDQIPYVQHSTGGLLAERVIYDGKKQLSLQFILTEWFLDYDDVRNPNYS